MMTSAIHNNQQVLGPILCRNCNIGRIHVRSKS